MNNTTIGTKHHKPDLKKQHMTTNTVGTKHKKPDLTKAKTISHTIRPKNQGVAFGGAPSPSEHSYEDPKGYCSLG